MNTDPENFEMLKKLLALKRHEQPPPGYFNDLPGKIWSRIEREHTQPSFWRQLFPAFGLNPAVAYACGLVVCGIMIIGIGSSLKNEAEKPSAFSPLAAEDPIAISPIPQKVGLAQENAASSTNPAFYPGPVNLRVEPVSLRELK